MGPRQAMQGRVVIVCVPSNSPQTPGLSRHSIHPALCLISNLNLTHSARKIGIEVISNPLFMVTFCVLKDQYIVQAENVIKYFFFPQLTLFFFHFLFLFHALSSVEEGVMVGGWTGSRWVRGRCGLLWSTISWSCATLLHVAETIWESGWKQASPQAPVLQGPGKASSAVPAC